MKENQQRNNYKQHPLGTTHNQRKNSNTDVSELTLSEKLQSVNTKNQNYKRRNSRNPSRNPSATNQNYKNQVNELKEEIKIIRENQNFQKRTGNINDENQHEINENDNPKNGETPPPPNRRAISKYRNHKCSFNHRRNNENIINLQRKIKETLKYRSDPIGNVINLTSFLFSKNVYKLLNKNLNFIPTPKLYNKKELKNDLDVFFRQFKLKAYFKDSPNETNSKKSKLYFPSKTNWTPKDNHHSIETYIEAVKKYLN